MRAKKVALGSLLIVVTDYCPHTSTSALAALSFLINRRSHQLSQANGLRFTLFVEFCSGVPEEPWSKKLVIGDNVCLKTNTILYQNLADEHLKSPAPA